MDIRSSLDQGLSLACLLGQLLVGVSNMNHSIGHRMLSGWVLYIGPELNLDMGPGLIKVGGDSQHLSLTRRDSLVNRE